MRKDRYNLEASDSFKSYEFISEGPKGRISKIVKYTETDIDNYYNLGFGNKLSGTDDFDDTAISNNQDSLRVLATVAATVYSFTYKYPEAWVYATGSTPSRTRLYQIGISNNLIEILEHFTIFGLKDDVWERYEINQPYIAFLITRKWNIL